MPNANDDGVSPQGHVQKDSSDIRTFSAATISALLGVVLLIVSILLLICYYELIISRFLNSFDPHDHYDITWINDVGKVAIYSSMIGIMSMILAMVFLVHGSLSGYRMGMKPASMIHAKLSLVRNLIIVAFVFATSSFGLRFILAEMDLDLSMEWTWRLNALLGDLQSGTWVCVSLILFIISRQMQFVRDPRPQKGG